MGQDQTGSGRAEQSRAQQGKAQQGKGSAGHNRGEAYVGQVVGVGISLPGIAVHSSTFFTSQIVKSS